MSVSPLPNASFLHGDRGKPSAPASERIVYATIDSLALKRATLPLQLLPHDDQDPVTEPATDETSSSRVDAAKYLLEASEQRSRISEEIAIAAPSAEQRETRGACSQRDTAIADDGGIDGPEIRLERYSRYSSSRDEPENDYSSGDYEKIEPATDGLACQEQRSGEEISRARCSFVKSKSAIDLTVKSFSDARLAETVSMVATLSEEKFTDRLPVPRERAILEKKKKRRFTRNVLHLVPEYLSRGSHRKGKKGINDLAGSSASLKAFPMEPRCGGDSPDTRYRSRSLSREELKRLKISSPSNFVHVASATSPNLVSDTANLAAEQAVIRHAEKCATLPLLGSWNPNTTPNRCPDQSITDGSDAADVAKLRRELLSELRARTAKALEACQQVKPNERSGTMAHAEKTASRAETPANSSFLWSTRSGVPFRKGARSNASRIDDNDDDDEQLEEDYDDVAPVKRAGSQEDDYDDVAVGASIPRVQGNRSREDSESIYDDVLGPSSALRENPSGPDGDSYVFASNEYSSVEEEMEEEEVEDGRDVYDDVGFPGEERVNSLYAGSGLGSYSAGSSWANGKESEWEDLEDSSAVAVPFFANKNSLSSGKSTETLAGPSKKKAAGLRWSRKVRRQRSKATRRHAESGPRNSMLHVTVSLGSGTVLLVGCADHLQGWKRNEDGSRRTQGLVQMRVIDLDEDVDTQETSCYVHEDTASDDSTYESLRSFHPDEFSSDSEPETETETETVDESVGDRNRDRSGEMEQKHPNGLLIEYLEAPTRPNPPPPPRELSLTRTLGKRIKMLRRTWSITKGSLGRMRRRSSVEDEQRTYEENHDRSNLEAGRYFGFARHFRRNTNGPLSTFYLNGWEAKAAEPIYCNTIEETDHYSMLADQEPLYQFYAEAAARVAYDSNSDGYEQVESTSQSRSTTDLVKPGHRTLWCQTPQVLGNGLLGRLSAEEKRVQEAKFEILTSEASYLNSLRVLRNEFLNESLIDAILTPAEKDKLFADIPNVLHASEQFLTELETLWRQDPMLADLPDVLLKYADKCLDIYVSYCSNQVSVDAALKDLRTRKGTKFDETLSQIEARGACQSLSLHSFLMLPMQRITRLPLLADAVLSKLPADHADKSSWEKVLASLSYIVTECNEAARVAAKQMEMETLARRLAYSPKIKPIGLKGKHLVKSGPVVQLSTKTDTEYKLTFGKRFTKTPLYLLLLTDYLLVAKYKSNGQDESYTVIDTCKRSLITLESIPEDSPFAGRNAMLLTLLENYADHQVEYVLTCESDTERQRWLEAVSPSKLGLIGETLYEIWDCPQVVALYCYSPNQPDELSLHPGDVINVFKKMNDGWYHGEKLLNGEQGWFPGNYTKEVASEHVRAKNLKQRNRFLTLSGNLLQRRAKQQSASH